MERELALIPGLLAHGIFTRPVTSLLVGWPDGRIQHKGEPDI